MVEQFMKSESSSLNIQLYRNMKNILRIVLFLLLFNDAFGAKPVSVTEGENVTLLSGETEIQTEDDILWMFGDESKLIAEINLKLKIFKTYDGADGRFGDRLELDRYTGSLFIRDSRTTDSGLYTMKIINKRATIYKRIYVTVSEQLLRYMIKIVSSFLLVGMIGLKLRHAAFSPQDTRH